MEKLAREVLFHMRLLKNIRTKDGVIKIIKVSDFNMVLDEDYIVSAKVEWSYVSEKLSLHSEDVFKFPISIDQDLIDILETLDWTINAKLRWAITDRVFEMKGVKI